MKLLHSKSTTEPILAVTACPCANLFGLVTQSSVVVYRSTTLTTVFTFSLKPFRSVMVDNDARRGAENGSWVCCCWSPSGRLFTLAIPSGLVLVLDVEGGAVVRYLTPGATSTASGDATGCSSTVSPRETPPRVSTTLPPDRPVLAMGWCSVPSFLSRQINDMHADMETRCLPVRTGLTAALLDELTQGSAFSSLNAESVVHLPSQFSMANNAYPVDAQTHSRSVSLLLVLGCDGILRCLLGGLYEVQRLALSLPVSFPASPNSGASGWEGVVVEDMHVCQFSVPSGSAVGKENLAQRGNGLLDWVCFGELASNGVRPAMAQQHRIYLTVSHSLARGSAEHSLWEVDVHASLSSLAVPHCLALCYVREYARIAREAYERIVREWHAVLRGRLWVHLGLPAFASLLFSAILIQITEPDPLSLYKYARGQLKRSAVAEDLEVMATVFKHTINEITCVCYPCCEAAISYTAHLRRPDTAVQHITTLRGLCDSLLRRVTREAEVVRDLAQWVLQQSRHWERESHLTMAAWDEGKPVEAEEDQRRGSPVVSSPPAAAAAQADMTRSPSPQQPPSVVDEVPLSATRQPELLKYLSSITTQKARVEDVPVSHLFTELDDSGQDCASVPALPRSALAARVVCPKARETDATPAHSSLVSQLLCCVVEGGQDADQRGPEAKEDEDEAAAEENLSDDDDGSSGAASGYHLRYETGLESVGRSAGNRDVARGECVAALVTERLHVYALRSSAAAGSTIQALRINAYELVLRYGSDVRDNGANSSATLASVLEAFSSADVGTSAIAPLLKTELTDKQNNLLSPATYVATWYGYLEEDRHIVVCQPNFVTTGHSTASVARNVTAAPAPFFVAVVDSDGCLVTVAEDEHSSDNENAEDAAACSGGLASSARTAFCEVSGMEGVPLRVSMSRARSFCVIVGITKYIILSLHDDDY